MRRVQPWRRLLLLRRLLAFSVLIPAWGAVLPQAPGSRPHGSGGAVQCVQAFMAHREECRGAWQPPSSGCHAGAVGAGGKLMADQRTGRLP